MQPQNGNPNSYFGLWSASPWTWPQHPGPLRPGGCLRRFPAFTIRLPQRIYPVSDRAAPRGEVTLISPFFISPAWAKTSIYDEFPCISGAVQTHAAIQGHQPGGPGAGCFGILHVRLLPNIYGYYYRHQSSLHVKMCVRCDQSPGGESSAIYHI